MPGDNTHQGAELRLLILESHRVAIPVVFLIVDKHRLAVTIHTRGQNCAH